MVNIPPSTNAQKAVCSGGLVIFFTILTMFIMPDIAANAESIKELDLKISNNLESIEEKVNRNYALLCHLSKGVHC